VGYTVVLALALHPGPGILDIQLCNLKATVHLTNTLLLQECNSVTLHSVTASCDGVECCRDGVEKTCDGVE